MKRGKNKAVIAIIVILALIFAGAAGFIIFKLVNGAAANDRYVLPVRQGLLFLSL